MRLPAIKHLSLCMKDIELCMEHANMYNCLRHNSEDSRDDDDDDDQGRIYDEEDQQDFIVRRMATMFPQTLEALILWDRPAEIAGQIAQGLVKIIRCGRYQNLKAIFLEATERGTQDESSNTEES